MPGSSSSGGVGFLGLLAILFIGLKLTGYIDWSWWWVTAPLWAPLAIGVVISLLIFIAAAVISFRDARRIRSRNYGLTKRKED